MRLNIYQDRLLVARLFGTPVLYSSQPIPQEDVPQGWYRYDLRGTARHPDEPHALVEHTEENYVGTILSHLPLKKERSQFRLVKDMFQMTGTNPTLADFCTKEHIPCPETPIRHLLRPASPEEAGLFYALPPEKDEELGCIGHVRMDFGHGGHEGFYHTWWPRGPEELNTPAFKEELGKVVNDLRKGVLKDLPSMRRYCYSGRDGALGAPAGAQRSGSGGERRKERSGVEFSPSGGNETGGVSSDEGGTYCQNYGFTLETERYLYRLRCNPIEGDYQAYLSCFDKQAQQMALTEQEQPPAEPAPVIGRITYAHDAPEEFTDPEKYLAAIREELPYHSTTGFRCETLTDDPEICKAVDDMLCDFYGEENSRTLADYGGAGMTIGGMGG